MPSATAPGSRVARLELAFEVVGGRPDVAERLVQLVAAVGLRRSRY